MYKDGTRRFRCIHVAPFHSSLSGNLGKKEKWPNVILSNIPAAGVSLSWVLLKLYCHEMGTVNYQGLFCSGGKGFPLEIFRYWS